MVERNASKLHRLENGTLCVTCEGWKMCAITQLDIQGPRLIHFTQDSADCNCCGQVLHGQVGHQIWHDARKHSIHFVCACEMMVRQYQWQCLHQWWSWLLLCCDDCFLRSQSMQRMTHTTSSRQQLGAACVFHCDCCAAVWCTLWNHTIDKNTMIHHDCWLRCAW